MKDNERGITLIVLAVVIIFIVAIIVAICSSNNDIGTNSDLLSILNKKEERSTYIPKCTTIDYKKLVENPDEYIEKDFTFTGKVIQVKGGFNNNVTLRANVTPDTNPIETSYSDTIYITYEYSSNEESRIQDGDIITIYGKSEGLYSYTDLTGSHSKVNLPSIKAMYIDIKEK